MYQHKVLKVSTQITEGIKKKYWRYQHRYCNKGYIRIYQTTEQMENLVASQFQIIQDSELAAQHQPTCIRAELLVEHNIYDL